MTIKIKPQSPLHPPLTRGELGWLLLLACFFLFPISAIAQSFTSGSYHIDWGNFNMTSGKKTSAHYQLTDTVGQNAPGKFTNTGFVVKAGFQYIYDLSFPFSFKIDNLAISFGALTPNVGTTQSNIITVSSPAGHGYQIMAAESHPLWLSPAVFIPNTGCDNTDCTDSLSALWNTAVGSTAYGFGFNAMGINTSAAVTGIGTSNYFPTAGHYRPFADSSAPAPGQIIMSENSPAKNHSALITYKIYISPLQAAGSYQNSINFTAVPKY